MSGRGPRSDQEANRALILSAAAAQLARDGRINMRRLAAEAGVSRSTLYRHFSTREGLEAELREQAAALASREARMATADEDRPPLAVVSGFVKRLVLLGAERRLGRLGQEALEQVSDDSARLALPVLDRVATAAEIAPRPPREWLEQASNQLVHACLATGAREPTDPPAAARALFDRLTEPLDQGIIVLDADGAVLSLNPRASEMLAPAEPAVGERVSELPLRLLYEDESPAPVGAHPLAASVRTGDEQSAVRGHVRGDGTVAWIEGFALPLREPRGGLPYGYLGVLYDVTAQRGWELERLRPPGRLGRTRPVPVDIARILDEIPPHLFPEQFASEARRIAGGPVALYVLDIDGTHLLRLSGPDDFPERLDAPLALGPELAEDGVPELRERIARDLPGASLAPMWVRGRAVGILLALGAAEDTLADVARHGAAAMELAAGYTDVFDAARRRKETEAAAELQQSLLPPRIARVGGGEIAGSVMPAYEVGGDWFDYVENRDGAWLAVADAVGRGATAAALGSIALAALRAARRSDATLEEAGAKMHQAVYDVSRPEFFVTAVVARWNAVYSTFSWINCGHPPPLVVGVDGSVEQLGTVSSLPLGLWERERRFSRSQRRLEAGERLVLHSDGVSARRTAGGLFGIDGIRRALAAARGPSATAAARSIQEAVMSAAEDPLQDDAVAVVLSPAS
ncbi:MAG: SpoIIE family protein phosphatase [Thermoleophilaceae bacterium]|nr:SpoIIE family protein phosphatase [Thermoleophilaceae bacterium]